VKRKEEETSAVRIRDMRLLELPALDLFGLSPGSLPRQQVRKEERAQLTSLNES
jgi:hypothetical protein